MRAGGKNIWSLRLFTCISKTDCFITEWRHKLNPLNCNWRENYYSTSILCSLISLSIFIKNKIILLRKITWWKLGNKKGFFGCCSWQKWQLLKMVSLPIYYIKFSMKAEYLRMNFLKTNCLRKPHKSRANLEIKWLDTVLWDVLTYLL